MKSRTTIFLLVLAIAVGGFIFLDYKTGTSTDEAREKSKRLIDLKAAEVTRFELVRTNETILVEKTGDRWEIRQPIAVPADPVAISSLVDQFEFAERDRTFTANELTPAMLDDFGLSTGKARLRLTLRDKKGDHTIIFGNETPTKESVYAQVQGKNTTCVVGKNVFHAANVSLNSIRSRTVLDFVPSAATRLELKQTDKLLQLDHSAAVKTNAEVRWVIAKPFPCRADQQKVGNFLNELSSLRVQDFASEDPKELHACQLDEPLHELTIWTGDKAQTLLIGRAPTNDVTKVYAKRKDANSIFTLTADSVKKLVPQVNDFRDAHLLVFNDPDVKGIDITRGTETISLTRTGTAWRVNLSNAVPFEGEDSVVQELLGKLSKLNAKQFVTDVAADLAPYGLEKPVATVALRAAGTNVLGQILIGSLNLSNAVRYVKRTDEPFVYGVDNAILGSLPDNALACRTRRIGNWREDRITKFTIEKNGDRLVLERGSDKKWKLVEPKEGVLDNDRFQNALDLFSYLRAENFEREGLDNLAAYGLDKPAARCTIEGDGRCTTIQIGNSKDQFASFASWSDPAIIFTLDAGSVSILTNRFIVTPTLTNAPPVVPFAK